MSGVPAFKLVEAGFSQPQVEALAEFMQTEAARRNDLLEVSGDLKAELSRLEVKIGDVKSHLEAKIGDVESRLEAKIGDVKIDMVRWMVGIAFAQTALILAVIRLFQH